MYQVHTYVCAYVYTYVCTYTYLHIMSSRLADMTALYAPMYISVSVSCLGGAFLTSNSNNAPPTTAECMSICQCVWVLLYLSPFRCLPLSVCVCEWCRMQAHAENALNPELEFASLISQIHTHTQIVTYLSHTQTLEIAKFTCVCVCRRRHGSGLNFCLKLIFERQKMCLFVVV